MRERRRGMKETDWKEETRVRRREEEGEEAVEVAAAVAPPLAPFTSSPQSTACHSLTSPVHPHSHSQQSSGLGRLYIITVFFLSIHVPYFVRSTLITYCGYGQNQKVTTHPLSGVTGPFLLPG
jgi:hypothetical protein